jgi:integrase
MGELKQRGKIWWVRYYRDGRRYEESSHSDKWADADRILKDREGDIAKGLPVTAAIGRMRFDDAAADLLTEYLVNARKSHQDVKQRIHDHLAPWFTGRRLVSITTADVRAYTAHRLKQQAAKATVNRELAALKRMYSLAMQAGKILRRPYIPMLREDNTRKGFFERAQFEAVRAHLPVRLRGVATFAYTTGWRTKSEILPLQWHQVDRAAGTVRLEPGTTKNRDGRVFVFTGLVDLQAAIDAQWAAHEALQAKGKLCPYVFARKNGTAIKSFRKAWITACAAAGCPGKIPHDFRRTAVRNLSRAGVPDTIAMKLTGHKTRSVFDRYDITSEEDLAEAARKLQTLTGTMAGTIVPPTLPAAVKPRKSLKEFGGPRGDRTHDHLIKSPPLKKAR